METGLQNGTKQISTELSTFFSAELMTKGSFAKYPDLSCTPRACHEEAKLPPIYVFLTNSKVRYPFSYTRPHFSREEETNDNKNG